ncbi:MAG: hypothetical protein A2X12_09160 [Bacteroidetes bacterium GWE2_29_8]|nr:MAG: hypothetical protein A2X12_09160 [Bacteroidetes bacterium GWE2_29_8]OFY20544.1 MAG: hypothetical protein A2X02_06220 [Bacteroidetes bacterium GWF2_29_10]
MKILFNLLLFLSLCSFAIAQDILKNDEPENAKYITSFTNYCSGQNEYNNLEATKSSVNKPPCWDSLGNDVWFKFTAVGNFVDIKIVGNTASNDATLENPRIVIYLSNDNFNTHTEICDKLIIKGNEAEFVNYNISIGSVYFVRISGSNNGTFKFCFTNYVPPPFPGPDCNSAAILSDENLVFAPPSFKGSGLDFNEGKNTCIDTDVDTIEHNTIWYKWTCANDGNLAFTITPQNPNDDLDFVLFKLPSINDCANKFPIRCMASAETGPTGLDFNSEDYEEYPGFSSTHDNFVKYVSMTKGETYALMIENFTTYAEGEIISGFNIGFDGELQFVGPKASFNISDTLFCEPNHPITLSNTSTDANRYQWYFGEGADKDPYLSMTTQPITVTYSNYGIKQIILKAWASVNPSEINAYSRLVYIMPLPQVTAVSDSNLCDGSAIKLTASNDDPINHYIWSTGETFNEIYVTEEKEYTVTSYNRYECFNSATVVIEPCEIPKDSIEIPNVFTPNNDDVNQYFEIKNIEQYPNSKLIVIDRWGKTVYESNNYKNDWDSKKNAGGTYFYFLEMEDGIKYKGIITVLK